MKCFLGKHEQTFFFLIPDGTPVCHKSNHSFQLSQVWLTNAMFGVTQKSVSISVTAVSGKIPEQH